MAVTPDQTMATLRRRLEERRARDSARAADVRRLAVGIVRSRLPPGGRAWLIGTLAWGDFGARSDVDLVFDRTPEDAIAEMETEIVSAAKVEVDVLHLADLPETFRARILREGLALHGE